MRIAISFVSDDVLADHFEEEVRFLVVLNPAVGQESVEVVVYLEVGIGVEALADLEQQFTYLRQLSELFRLVHAFDRRDNDFYEFLDSYKVWYGAHLAD